jgi:hypothetical protein
MTPGDSIGYGVVVAFLGAVVGGVTWTITGEPLLFFVVAAAPTAVGGVMLRSELWLGACKSACGPPMHSEGPAASELIAAMRWDSLGGAIRRCAVFGVGWSIRR